MKMDVFETLKTLNACFGPSGQEREIGEKIAELARPFADDITTDVMGNVIVHVAGKGPKVMFAAHMDSIGFIVTHIQEDGFLRVGKVGGIYPTEVLGTPVRFANGTLGAVYEEEGLEKKTREMSHLFIDIGAPSGEEAKKRVQVGDMAVYNTPTFKTGEAVISPYLDNRICCVALLKALELVNKKSGNDLYFVFTVQEEVGLRGAQTAAFGVDPDYAVVTDVTHAGEIPGMKKGSCSSKAGGGAAIKVMDTSVICHPEMVKRLKDLAEEKKIPYQMDVITGGGTDGGAIHKSRGGVKTGGVSVPCRNTHNPQEGAFISDVEATAKLMAAFAKSKLPPADKGEK